MSPDMELRLECVRLASGLCGDLVENAQKLYEFVKNEKPCAPKK